MLLFFLFFSHTQRLYYVFGLFCVFLFLCINRFCVTKAFRVNALDVLDRLIKTFTIIIRTMRTFDYGGHQPHKFQRRIRNKTHATKKKSLRSHLVDGSLYWSLQKCWSEMLPIQRFFMILTYREKAFFATFIKRSVKSNFII